jgi:uncharacterized OsmC-like protein
MYNIKVENRGDTKFYAVSKDYSFTIDTEGEGIKPLDTLLAALCSCTGVYIKYFMAKTPLPFKEFTVQAEAELTKERPVMFKSINVVIIPKEGKMDQQIKTKLTEFVKNCPVHNTFKNNPEVLFSVKD